MYLSIMLHCHFLQMHEMTQKNDLNMGIYSQTIASETVLLYTGIDI